MLMERDLNNSSGYIFRFNELYDDYEVLKSDNSEEVISSFVSSDYAEQWVGILQGVLKLEMYCTLDTDTHNVEQSDSKNEWRVVTESKERVAVFRHASDAYVWRDIMNGRYSLKRRSQ